MTNIWIIYWRDYNMLKIKDNVDIKELEKYGFKKQKLDDGRVTEYRRCYFDEPDTITSVIEDTKEVIDWCDAFTYDWGERESVLCDDLIKDGLVEKVEK